MSADNCLAILQLQDGFRIADILMIWDGEQDRLFDSYNKQQFSQSAVYQDQDQVDVAVQETLAKYRKHQQVLEYGVSTYTLPMAWSEYLAHGSTPLLQCPVCDWAVSELHPLTPETPDALVCKDCINGTTFEH